MIKERNIAELDGEIWKPVPDLEDGFEVSNFSRIRNKTTKTILGPQLGGSKYKFFMLYDKYSKKRIKKYLHRMVAQQFVPNPYKSHEVNHIDGNKLNNDVSNLEWVTASENQKHAVRTGLRTQFFRVGDTNGENNKSAKLTWEKVDEIRAWANKEYRTLKQMERKAKKYGISFTTIYDVIKGKKWEESKRHLSNGTQEFLQKEPNAG